MHSAGYAVARCLSVRLSVCHMPVFCRNGSTCHQTFSPSCSQTILVISVPNVMAIFRRESPPLTAGGVEWVWKIAIFDQYLAISRKWYKIGPQLLWSVDSNSNAIYRMVSFQLSDIEWLSEIFNDAKHCTASLRQLSFLFCIYFSSVHAYATQFRPPPPESVFGSRYHHYQFIKTYYVTRTCWQWKYEYTQIDKITTTWQFVFTNTCQIIMNKHW